VDAKPLGRTQLLALVDAIREPHIIANLSAF